MPTTLFPSRQFVAALEVKDGDGNPVALSNPVWSTDNPSLVAALPLPAETPALKFTATIESLGGEGVTTVICRALTGQVPVLGTMTVVVSAGGVLITDLSKTPVPPPEIPMEAEFLWSVTHVPPTPVPEGATVMADLHAGEQITFGVSILDAFGNPATIEGGSWDATPADILVVVASDPAARAPKVGVTAPPKPKDVNTPYFCTVEAIGKMGSGTVSFRADADLGEGIKPIIGTAAVNVLGGEAVSITLEEIPPPAAPESAKKKGK